MIRKLFRKPKPLKKFDKSTDRVKSALVASAGTLMPTDKSPDELYGELFHEVQKRGVYADGKTFVDMVPRKRARELKKEYKLESKDPDFNLNEFVNRHFYTYTPRRHVEYAPSEATTAREHVTELWRMLERRNRKTRGSLVPLPHAYVVPGGRFEEQFYWDTYFIMLGLAADDEWGKISGMMKNYAFMLRKFGMIPTANRTYFTSRSQPPFFAYMVRLLASHRGRTRTYAEYLPSMLSEYRFWMKGRRSVKEHTGARAVSRVVRMPNGIVLNRYFDNKATPRQETLQLDMETAEQSRIQDKEKIFVDLRAGAESGWDFSSRWFRDPRDIQTIHTTDIVPVDLNCLLYQLERTIGEAYILIKQPLLAKRFSRAAEQRAATTLRYCWDAHEQFFTDYDFQTGVTTGKLTLAGVFPLYARIASSEQAEAVARRIEKDFLKDGGLLTTLEDNGQQWDAPNGWAPLHWVVIQGLREYGYHALANEIRDRWLATNELVFARERRMIEKYNVVSPGVLGGGGEYPLQDGFGWTNGVYAALKDEQDAS